MRILIMVSSLNFGGAEKQAVLDANMLSTAHDVYLGTFAEGPLSEQLASGVKKVIFSKKNYFSAAARVASFLKQKDIQLVHNHLYAPMIIAALASVMVRVPIFWHFHGHHFEVRKTPLNILSRLPTVKRIIFVCSALAGYFENSFSFPSKKVSVVYNSTQCQKLPLPENGQKKLLIGFVGRVVGLKRIQYLVRLADFLKKNGFSDFEIQIAGDGPERKKLEQMSEELGTTQHVRFLGFRSDIDKLFSQFDLFILPSEEEALSLSLIDAGNCQLPCIAFDVGGNKEIVKDGETGFIVHSEKEMQQRTLQLCQDAQLRRRLGRKAEEHNRIFSEEQHLESLLDIYRQYA
ncbi:MAG: glycosyltransferase family 4 protein [Cyclobacteriaceae bacterium]